MVLLSMCIYAAVVGVYESRTIQNWSFPMGFVPLAFKVHLYCNVYQNRSIIHIQHSAVSREPYYSSTHLPMVAGMLVLSTL